MDSPSVLTCVAAAIALLLPGSAVTAQSGERVAQAPPGAVRMFVSGALRAPVEAVRAEAQRAVGRPLVIQYSESRILQRDIESGQPFELALLTAPVVDDMIARGRIVPGSRIDLATVPLGVAQRGGRPHDVSTPAALRRTLLGAKAIRRFYGVGASVPGIEAMLDTLGINGTLKSRMVALGAGPVSDVALAPGEYELTVNLASEVVPLKDRGWSYLGVVPRRFQAPVTISAGLGSAGDARTAHVLARYLRSDAFAPALKANAMFRISGRKH